MIQKWVPVLLLFTIVSLADAQKKVRLQDVTSITLHRGQKSTGRRSSPVPQLLCVGGTAQGKFSPSTVQCYNRGFDGNDVQWECTAEMPSEYKFGRISVSCEGYDYPDDPYILSGSCALKYELDYTQKGAHNTFYNDKTGGLSFFDMVIIIVVILMIAFVLYSWCSGDTGTSYRSGYGGGYPGGGGGGGGGPDPPGWRPPPSAPPSYDEATGPKAGSSTGNTGNAGGGPGFWTGLGLGGLGGYMAGRGTGTGYGTRQRRSYYDNYDSGYNDNYGSSYSSGPSHSGTSNETHTSSGFGGTERR